MMLCVRMSTCSCCARSSALRSGRTPNAMTIAPEAEASSTSFSVTAPTPEPMIFSFTWSVESLGSISLSTSTEPCTSPLITIPNSLTSPAFSCSWSWSSVMREPLMRAIAASRCLPWRYSTTCRALASSVTWKRSPASGTPCKPSTSTGVDGAASLVHARFQHRARRRRIRVSLQLPQIRDQQNRFEQLLDALLLFRGDFHELRVAAPFSGHQAVFRQLPFRALQLRFRLVDLVDRHDDRHLRGSRVVDRFLRLRHDAIIGRHHQHYDIGNLRASRAHPCKRLVARRIHEHHRAIIDDHLVSADVLGDPARFARGNIRFANGVQQTRLAVIDVAHYCHHRRPRLQTFLGLFLRNLEHHLLFERDHAHYSAKRFGKCRGGRHIQRLVDAGKHAAVEQVLQDVLGAHIQLFGQFANRDAFRNRHVARRTRLRRRDDRGRGAAACARTLPRRVQFALTFLLALIQNGTLALRRLARVKRLARLRLRRQFLWKRRQHPRTPGCARAGARSGRHRAATLFKWPRLWSARAAGSWREWPSLSGLLWTHRLPWTRAACTRFSRCVRKRSAIPTRQWTAISCRRWPSWSA